MGEQLSPEGASQDLETFEGRPVEVRRNGGLLGLVGIGALVLAVAYAWRAADGTPVASLVAVLLGVLGIAFTAAAADARGPVMVVDLHGFRYRDGRTWTGVPWEDVLAVEVARPRRPWQDGRIEVRLADGQQVTTRVGLSTPLAQDAVARLRRLSDGRAVVADVVTPEPLTERAAGSASAAAPAAAPVGAHDPFYDQEADPEIRPQDRPADDPVPDPVPAPEPEPEVAPAGAPADEGSTPRPVARLVAQAAVATRAVRANLSRSSTSGAGPGVGPVVGTSALRADEVPAGWRSALPEADHLDPRTDRPGLVLEPVPAPAEPAAVVGPPPVVWEAEVPEVAIVGEQVAAARRRLGLSIDSLAERTRIRPHVIEAVEIDDFEPCGGDFYARGHLRSLARILGLDADALVAQYDEHYAQAPVGAAKVFEAELATGPAASLRLTTGGPNWGALLGVVMVVAIIWGLGHLLTDREEAPAEVGAQPAPSAAATEPAVDPGSVAGLGAPTSNRLVLRGRGEPTRVVVKDAEGETVWSGRLADGDAATVRLVGRGTIAIADGGAVAVRVGDRSLGRLGDPGQRVERPIGKR